ncbi:MAG: molybdopterin-binding protein [Thermodesulfovibrionales bacterium]|nr:molybdopterin-binding protein [Thermodesulfovibrionales bacterium]
MGKENKNAGIIIIGDEILSGMVRDTNSHYIIEQLRDIGIETERVIIIRDRIDEISQSVCEFSRSYDVVFTSGGIGPTHDDVTIDAISKGFGVSTKIDNILLEHLKRIIGKEPTDVQKRMALIPDGAEVIAHNDIGLPLIKFKNIFILPGIPQCLQRKMIYIKKILETGQRMYIKQVYVNEYESAIALTLSDITERIRGIKIGSYPVLGNNDYKVMVTFSSYNIEDVNTSAEYFIRSLNAEKVVKIEYWGKND